MAFYSGFFNSKGLDRTYTAEDFTEYLSSIICNGILDTYGQNFSLTASAVGLRVILGTGKAWINGHYFVNDTRHTIDLAEYQDESLPRYVAISILLDTSENVRSVSLEITPGTPAENPSLPSFPQSENKARLLMYAVRLNVGATSLTERDWYDYREDKNVCGYCKCILGKCKVTEMQSQLAQLIAEIKGYNAVVSDLTGKVVMLQTKVDDLTGDIVATGSLGENIYYVKYSNGRLLLRGTGATYDYDLGESPFWEDEDIRSLVVSEGITAIGSSVFERCSNMISASFPNTLKSIGKRAFFMYTTGGLTSLDLPASVTKIGEKAFTNISAASLVMPETLTELGTYLFMDSNTLQNVRVECAEIPAFCFVNCSRLNQMTLSANVKKIGAHMINYCSLLREITYLQKKRVKNTGIMPQYYIEGDHEAIIPKELFLMVQEEIVRRSEQNVCFGRKKGFSSNHAFSQIVFCVDCGAEYRRIHWNNRGKKSIVWRCRTRLEHKDQCHARTVSEETLISAFLDALNEMVGNSDEYLTRLKENLETAINAANPESAAALAARMAELQQELIDRTEKR